MYTRLWTTKRRQSNEINTKQRVGNDSNLS